MTEFEILEANFLAGDMLQTSAMNCIALIFAYVVAAHFAGKMLSRSVAIATSMTYSLVLIGPLNSFFNSVLGMITFRSRYFAEFGGEPSQLTDSMGAMLTLSFLPLGIGWLMSLIYMHKVIRRDAG